MGTVKVRCRADGKDRTRVIVTYALTGLSVAGNAVLTDMTAEKYGQMLAEWRGWIVGEILPRLP
jgi:hypothetical protein